MGELVKWVGQLMGKTIPEGGIVSTFDLTKDADKVQMYRCMIGSDKQAKDLVGTQLAIVNAVAHTVRRIDDATGEERPGLRCVLSLADGTRVATSSGAVWDGLQQASVILGRKPPFDPPLMAVIRSAKSMSGPRSYLWLDLV